MRTYIFLLCLIVENLCFGQIKSDIEVTGRVLDNLSHKPVGYVNVILVNKGNSNISSATITDEEGIYIFTHVSSGRYLLRFSSISYDTDTSKTFMASANPVVDIGDIMLNLNIRMLNETTVTAERNILETYIDKKVYNVDKNIVSIAGSASNLLVNIPSVTVDLDGTIKLRGSEKVTILVNGKPSPMMKINPEEVLQQISSMAIEKIEVITSPSSKFKPDGAAGIINIILKKDFDPGFNGEISANVGNDSRYNTTLSMNYNAGKINLYGSYSIKKDSKETATTDEITDKDSTGRIKSYYNQSGIDSYRPLSHIASFGIDYEPDGKNSIGVSGKYFFMGFDRNENNHIITRDSLNRIKEDYLNYRTDHQTESDIEGTFSYNHKFKKPGNDLKIETNLADHHEKEDNFFTVIYNIPSEIPQYDKLLYQFREKNIDGTAEYSYPLTEDFSFDCGYNYSWQTENFDYFSQHYNSSSNTWGEDPQKTNQFTFGEQIHALYASFNGSAGESDFLLGLRGEMAFIKLDQVTLDSVSYNKYFKLFPTLQYSYKFREGEELKISYSRRVTRPQGDDLNPFIDYSDPAELTVGNPYLKPEVTNSYEITYQKKRDHYSFFPAIYFRQTFEAFTEIKGFLNDSTVLTRIENFARNQSAGVECIFSWQPTSKLKFNGDADLYYNVIDGSDIGYSSSQSAVAAHVKIMAGFNITKHFIMQVNGMYRSATITPQGKYLPQAGLDIGGKYDLFKKKASLVFSINDVFNSMKWRSVIDDDELFEYKTTKHEAQVLYIGFQYNFGIGHPVKHEKEENE